MNNQQALFRPFHATDYAQCEALVSEAWEFDKNFQPQALADMAKFMYTKGALVASNFMEVVEVNGQVVGFLFGLNYGDKRPARAIWLGFTILWRLMRIKGMPKGAKKALINAINTHEINRSKLVDRKNSEISLFVVGKDYKGKGYGKRLWVDFLDQCKACGEKRVIVETNHLGASRFYEQQGFSLIGDFDSPLHAYATPDGQACMYQYNL